METLKQKLDAFDALRDEIFAVANEIVASAISEGKYGDFIRLQSLKPDAESLFSINDVEKFGEDYYVICFEVYKGTHAGGPLMLKITESQLLK